MSRYSDVMFHYEQPSTASSLWYLMFAVLMAVSNIFSVPASDPPNGGGGFAEFLPQSSIQESEPSVQNEIFRYNLYPEDGSTIFLRNVAKLLSDYVT
jgi:hypothetical protein